MNINWKSLLDGFFKYIPIVISILAFYYSRKKDKLQYATRFLIEIQKAGIGELALALQNLGPGDAYSIRVSAFFIRFYEFNIPILKSWQTLTRKVVFSKEYFPAKELKMFSINADDFEDRNFSRLIKWAIKVQWRGLDGMKHSKTFIYNNKSKRFNSADLINNFRFQIQRFIYSNLRNLN